MGRCKKKSGRKIYKGQTLRALTFLSSYLASNTEGGGASIIILPIAYKNPSPRIPRSAASCGIAVLIEGLEYENVRMYSHIRRRLKERGLLYKRDN